MRWLTSAALAGVMVVTTVSCASKTSKAIAVTAPAAVPVAAAAVPVANANGAKTMTTTVIGHEQATLTHLKSIPAADIEHAKQVLHIGYGHTSHGSQLTSGMKPLDAFMGGHGLYTFSANGQGGALHLYEGGSYNEQGDLAMDCGYIAGEGRFRYEDETLKFLGEPDAQGRGSKHPEFNVILWSFCGQMSGFEPKQVQWYLDGMKRLDQRYPGVVFVRMTGHLDGSGTGGKLHRNNELVRADCRANSHWLYDFADIESYDPDGNEYLSKGANDNCDYQGRNWARQWQASHQEGVDWYQCSAAHSQPLNGNRKAYAAWALFAAIAQANG